MMMVAGKADPLPSLDAAVSVMLADVQLFCVVWYPNWYPRIKHPTFAVTSITLISCQLVNRCHVGPRQPVQHVGDVVLLHADVLHNGHWLLV